MSRAFSFENIMSKKLGTPHFDRWQKLKEKDPEKFKRELELAKKEKNKGKAKESNNGLAS